MTQTEALKLALEALETERENYQDWDKEDGAPEYIYEAITAMKELLAQPEQEPVACVQDLDEVKRKHLVYEKGMDWKDPLYTTPPQRKPLTDEQILHFVDTHVGAPSMAYPLDNSDWINFARAIEAAHNIKE